MRLTSITLAAWLLAGCGGPSERVQHEDELREWGDQIQLVLRPAQDGDPCAYYASDIEVNGFELTLTASVTVECPDEP